MKKETEKQVYSAPSSEMLEMHLEGVIADSPGVNSSRSEYIFGGDATWGSN